jgi:hypothetical protein
MNATTTFAKPDPPDMGDYITAYSGDLGDESLDGQLVVVGGRVTGPRTYREPDEHSESAISVLDRQGWIRVVLPPDFAPSFGWGNGSLVVVAGRLAGGSLVAEYVELWDTTLQMGPVAFAESVAALS